jgi:hypothetical protein
LRLPKRIFETPATVRHWDRDYFLATLAAVREELSEVHCGGQIAKGV